MVTKQTNAVPVLPPTDPTRRSLRTQNLRAALQHVYREGVTTRADLSRLTGLTRATVSELVSRLVVDDLVRETGQGTSSGGKPPTLLELNPGGRTIVAIDLSRRPFGGALVDLSGRIHHRATAGRGSPRGPQGLRDVFRLADRLVAEATSPVLGVGVGTPGIVDRDGAVVEAANIEWHGVPLRRELAERLERPVTVANDAHVGALAELGAHPDGNLVLVKVGLGIGAGIVVDGRLHLGDRPAAGEIGHIRVVERGAHCRCGNRGCLETVASVPSIIGSALRLAGRDPAEAADLPWDASELGSAIGSAPVARAVERAGRHVGVVLAHLVAILDIHRIVLALELTGASAAFLEAVGGEIGKRVLPDLAPVVELTASATGPDLVLSGAAALVLREQLGVSWR